MPFPPDGKPPLAARLRVARLNAFRLAYAPQMARLTQAVVEAGVVHEAPLRATQVPVEVVANPDAAAGTGVPMRVTQLAVETVEPYVATLRLTQGAVEIFIIPPPCYNGQFPIDTV